MSTSLLSLVCFKVSTLRGIVRVQAVAKTDGGIYNKHSRFELIYFLWRFYYYESKKVE